MGNQRQQILETTCILLETQGYHATGLNQIVQESGAPKGSLYYYFPEGKEAIAATAIEQMAQHMVERMRTRLDQEEDAAEAVKKLVETIAEHVETSSFCSGGPLQAVAVETATTNVRLNQVCRQAYAHMQKVFSEKLEKNGYSNQQAHELGAFIVVVIEGGIILSRTNHNGDALRSAAGLLAQVIRANGSSQIEQNDKTNSCV